MNQSISQFEQLAASRRQWIEDVLRPWCRVACRKDLIKAEDEWVDIAGRAAAEQTLWTWAWERFPDLVHDGLTGVNETQQVTITLTSGESHTGYPEGRRSQRGELLLVLPDEQTSTSDLSEAGPFSLDEIARVEVV